MITSLSLPAAPAPVVVPCGDLQVDVGARLCAAAGREIALSPREFTLPHLLLARQGHLVP